MKFKDIVVVIFLSGVLIYAACCRSNIIKNTLMVSPEKEASITFNWQDTIHFRNLEITADTVDGITIRNNDGEILSSITSLKTEAIDLHQNQVLNGDTLQLLFCDLTTTDTISCFRVMDDGSLKKINL